MISFVVIKGVYDMSKEAHKCYMKKNFSAMAHLISLALCTLVDRDNDLYKELNETLTKAYQDIKNGLYADADSKVCGAEMVCDLIMVSPNTKWREKL